MYDPSNNNLTTLVVGVANISQVTGKFLHFQSCYLKCLFHCSVNSCNLQGC